MSKLFFSITSVSGILLLSLPALGMEGQGDDSKPSSRRKFSFGFSKNKNVKLKNPETPKASPVSPKSPPVVPPKASPVKLSPNPRSSQTPPAAPPKKFGPPPVTKSDLKDLDRRAERVEKEAEKNKIDVPNELPHLVIARTLRAPETELKKPKGLLEPESFAAQKRRRAIIISNTSQGSIVVSVKSTDDLHTCAVKATSQAYEIEYGEYLKGNKRLSALYNFFNDLKIETEREPKGGSDSKPETEHEPIEGSDSKPELVIIPASSRVKALIARRDFVGPSYGETAAEEKKRNKNSHVYGKGYNGTLQFNRSVSDDSEDWVNLEYPVRDRDDKKKPHKMVPLKLIYNFTLSEKASGENEETKEK